MWNARHEWKKAGSSVIIIYFYTYVNILENVVSLFSRHLREVGVITYTINQIETYKCIPRKR